MNGQTSSPLCVCAFGEVTFSSVVSTKFSLRYKILLLLTAIPTFALLVYLLLALNIFKEDKIAYVFDSSSQVSSSVASQVKIQMTALLTGLKPVLQDYLQQRKFSANAPALFKSESMSDLIMVLGVDPTTRQWAVVDHVAKTDNDYGIYEREVLFFLPKISADMYTRTRGLFGPLKNGSLVLAEKVVDPQTKATNIFLIVFQLLEFKEMFSTAGAQNLYLIDHSGRIVFGPEGTAEKKLSSILPLNIEASGSIGQGTQKVRANNKDLLVSYAKTGFADLMIVNSIDQSTALSAMQILVRKSFIFFVILMSAIAMVSLLAAGTITKALSLLFDATQKVSEGKFDIRVNIKSSDEVGSLAKSFNLMAEEVQRLLLQTAEKARMESELQTAKTVQETLFPETQARIGSLQIAGFYEPASECGGDWWNYSAIGNKVYLWIGDATGHGAPAALITSAAKSASAIIERLNVGPAQALELLNRCIYDVSKGRIMMTFFLGVYDTQSGVLTYTNASHEAPYMIRKKAESPTKEEIEFLNENNNPRLGQSRDSQYTSSELRMNPGDTIIFYTDGVMDIQNLDGKAYGERRFIKSMLQSLADYPTANDGLQRLAEGLQTYRQNTGLVDDVTFFVVKRDEQEGTV